MLKINILQQQKKDNKFNTSNKNIIDIVRTFDVKMVSYDGAEICELIGMYIINN